jgi:hypothetical protein
VRITSASAASCSPRTQVSDSPQHKETDLISPSQAGSRSLRSKETGEPHDPTGFHYGERVVLPAPDPGRHGTARRPQGQPLPALRAADETTGVSKPARSDALAKPTTDPGSSRATSPGWAPRDGFRRAASPVGQIRQPCRVRWMLITRHARLHHARYPWSYQDQDVIQRYPEGDLADNA